jgi:hypothetical protein
MIILSLVVLGVWAGSEINANLTLKVTKGYLSYQRSVNNTLSITNTAPNVAGLTMSVPNHATGTLVSVGSVLTNGVAWFGNLDTTNYVEVGRQVSGTFYALFRINPGEAWPVRLVQGADIFARANSTNVNMEYAIFDN